MSRPEHEWGKEFVQHKTGCSEIGLESAYKNKTAIVWSLLLPREQPWTYLPSEQRSSLTTLWSLKEHLLQSWNPVISCSGKESRNSAFFSLCSIPQTPETRIGFKDAQIVLVSKTKLQRRVSFGIGIQSHILKKQSFVFPTIPNLTALSTCMKCRLIAVTDWQQKDSSPKLCGSYTAMRTLLTGFEWSPPLLEVDDFVHSDPLFCASNFLAHNDAVNQCLAIMRCSQSDLEFCSQFIWHLLPTHFCPHATLHTRPVV